MYQNCLELALASAGRGCVKTVFVTRIRLGYVICNYYRLAVLPALCSCIRGVTGFSGWSYVWNGPESGTKDKRGIHSTSTIHGSAL